MLYKEGVMRGSEKGTREVTGQIGERGLILTIYTDTDHGDEDRTADGDESFTNS